MPARGQHTEKQQQLNHHKGFAEQKQTGYEGSLSCIRWWARNEAAFPTVSDGNRVHCAIVLKQSRLFIQNTNSRVLPDESKRGCTHTCMEQRKRAVYTQKHALGLKYSWGKSPQKNKPKGNWEEKQKAVCWKDIRASSMQFLPNTCSVVFALLNNRTRPPFVIAWTVLTLDCAQLDSFSSLWSYKADERWADWEGQKGKSTHLDRTHNQEHRQRFIASQGSQSWKRARTSSLQWRIALILLRYTQGSLLRGPPRSPEAATASAKL